MKRLFVAELAAIMLIALSFTALSARSEPVSALVRLRLTKDLSPGTLVERGIDVLHIYPDGRADCAVTDEQLAWIASTGALVSVLDRAALAAPSALDANLGLYYTHAEMEAALDSLAAAYPGLACLDTMGASYEGRIIRAIKISDNAATDENEPELLITGCHHARELMSVDVPLRFARYLLENYGTNAQVAELVNTREVWIAPMINPDGHVYVENNHSAAWYSWWRKNRRPNGDGSYGIDLNRNYGYLWGYDNVGSSGTTTSEVYRGTAPFSEPETRAVRDLCARREFVFFVSYHSYGELILFPWGYAPLDTDDHELFVALGDSVKQGNDYLAGNTASGAIYSTNGGSDDWGYGDVATKNTIYSFTVEMNTYAEGGFAPAESLIIPTFQKLLDLNMSFIRFAGNPRQVLGPWTPAMNPVTMLNAPNYEISWTGGEADDPNPPLSYELTEIKNLAGTEDSCETGDSLWVSGGFTLTTARAAAGSYSYFSGSGNGLFRTLGTACIFPDRLGSTLSCRLWYDLEVNWDYAYLQGSADDGVTWVNLPGTVTTTYDPNGANRGNGITGSSGDWIEATFDLSGIQGGALGFTLLRFLYVTDQSIYNEGVYIDLVSPTPRAERRSVLASGLESTWYHRWPAETGDFLYYVRAFDADGQASHRSDLVSHEIVVISESPLPAPGTSLAQGYPNPFNPSTTIRFSIGAADAGRAGKAAVRLALYDVSGRNVAVLRETSLAPGEYSAVWSGTGAGGAPLASGVYFARLTVGGKTLTEKLVLIR